MSSTTDRASSDSVSLEYQSIPQSGFGRQLSPGGRVNCNTLVREYEKAPQMLTQALDESDGLLLLPGLQDIVDHPELLLRMSKLCGSTVENYRQTLTRSHLIHPLIDEILVLGNRPPSNRKSPEPPVPALTASGELPVQFPHRRGWHTDQSFRRPPPDISLFFCVTPCKPGQGQTLFADGVAAYNALSPDLQQRIEGLQGLHALLGTGRSEQARLQNDTVQALLTHQQSQPQPLVRTHPVTAKKALYLCENEQMDWLDGPIVGMQPGPVGDGAELIYELMTHFTSSAFTYAHDWKEGDLVIYDNRCLIHSATWYDDSSHDRLMWRTTVSGNPGPEYAGESPSWIPAQPVRPLQGLE